MRRRGQDFPHVIENTFGGIALANTCHSRYVPNLLAIPNDMNKSLIVGMIPKFLGSYDSDAKDKIWQQHGAAFRRFWSEQVLSGENGVIPEEACDRIIRILDEKGKGNTKESEAVAGGIMMPPSEGVKMPFRARARRASTWPQ